MPILLADRFGGGPFIYWDTDVLQRDRLFAMLALEGEVAKAYEGMEPGEEMFGYGPDGYDDEPDPDDDDA